MYTANTIPFGKYIETSKLVVDLPGLEKYDEEQKISKEVENIQRQRNLKSKSLLVRESLRAIRRIKQTNYATIS